MCCQSVQCDSEHTHTHTHKEASDLRLEIVNYFWIIHLLGLELWKGLHSPSHVCFSFQYICSLMEHAVIKSFSCGCMNKQTCCKPVLVKLINPIVQFICFVSYPTPPPPPPPPHHHQCHPLGALFPPQCSLLPPPIGFLLQFRHTVRLLALSGVQSQHGVTGRSSFECAPPPTPGCGGRGAPALSG